MRCKGCDRPISVRDSKQGGFEDLCLTCRRASQIESDYESSKPDVETEDLLLLLFGRVRKRRQDE